jgi:hypothetical protein
MVELKEASVNKVRRTNLYRIRKIAFGARVDLSADAFDLQFLLDRAENIFPKAPAQNPP